MSNHKPFMSPPDNSMPDPQFDEDNPEWMDEDFARATPAHEASPELREAIYKAFPNTSRGPQKAAKKVPVSIRLSPEVVERFKADGPGWQARIDAVLKKAVGL